VKTAYIVFAHGSRIEAANDAVRALAAELAHRGGYELVEVAFLDCAPPDLSTVIGRLAEQGATRIVVIPYFLTLGRHTAEDLPRIAAEASRIHNGIRVDIAPPMDGHAALIGILLDRAREIAD